MERIRFANQLRAVAALSVAASHLIGVYWALPEIVSIVTATPAPAGEIPGIFWLTSLQWFNLGPFGVAIFFLISGLVVPFSLERHSRGGFMLARLLRIYPTFAAATLIEVAVVVLSARSWHRPVPFDAAVIVGNVTLINDLIGQASIDLVNWTLSVELKFYLLIAILAPVVRRGSAVGLVIVAAGVCAANVLFSARGDEFSSTPFYTFSSQSLCMIYMLTGTLFNFHIRGRLHTAGLIVCVAILMVLFVVTWRVSVWMGQFPFVTACYFYALALFAALYAVREHVPPNRVLDALANISFPFYLLHSLLGYTFLRVGMVALALPYYGALVLAVGGVILVAMVLHRIVERPTQRLGRAAANRLDGNRLQLSRHPA